MVNPTPESWIVTVDMDILVNSVDVRDLLSSPDLLDSPSSPLSAPDLRLLISRLESHTLKIKSKVQSYLLSHQNDFSSLFSQCSDVVFRSEELSGQVSELLSLISKNPIEADLSGIIGETVEKKKQVREKKELLELLGVVLELNDKLRVVKEDIRIGRVVEAAEGLKELKTAMRIRNDELADEVVEGEPVVYGLLRNEWAQCFEEVYYDFFLYLLFRFESQFTETYMVLRCIACLKMLYLHFRLLWCVIYVLGFKKKEESLENWLKTKKLEY